MLLPHVLRQFFFHHFTIFFCRRNIHRALQKCELQPTRYCWQLLTSRSRIIVNNLPLNVDEQKLKAHFAKGHKGESLTITDVKIIKTKDGRSRRFGFIGFNSDDEAKSAVKQFNLTFIGTTRIKVDFAEDFREKPVKRSREESRPDAPKKLKEAKSEKKDEEPVDERIEEYMSLMRPRQEQKTWANDMKMTYATEDPVSAKDIASPPPVEGESDDEYETIPQKIQETEALEDEPMISLAELGNEQTEEVENDGFAKDENVSDLEWLKMRSQRIKEDVNGEPSKEKSEEDDISENPRLQKLAEKKKLSEEKLEEDVKSDFDIAAEKIAKTGRLFLRNLPYNSTEEQFRELFSKYGSLEEVHLPVDPKSGKSKGFLYVQFSNSQDAVDAFENEDRNVFHGRILHILPADPKRENRLDEIDMKNLPLKKQQELKRKANAAKHQFSWNSLYLNSDAVMESVAARMGVSKSELINPDSADSAVKQAIAETSVINNVKQYFESKGVNLESFSKKEKSDLVILVKNFPYNTTIEEITDLFAQYGDLRKVLLPPDGGIAMVVFKTAPQARAAFTKLAYRRFKTGILYLEKGPKGLFDEESNDNDDNSVAQVVKEAKISANDLLEAKADVDDKEAVFNGPTVSIFVKNLSFSTSSADLGKAFGPLEGFATAKVQMKPDSKNPGKLLSMGFGFVEFKDKESADTALDVMQGHVLAGHKLQLKLSHRGQNVDSGSQPKISGKPKSKIIIKNIPFEASKKDIQKLLGSFGQLRTLRMPQKFNKSARGFAFAEFITHKEAENAMKSLQGTHLLGRRLVMEYAQQDATNAEEELSRLEAKVQKQVTRETLQGLRLTGKRNLDLDDEEEGFE